MARPNKKGKNRHNQKRNKGPQTPADERLWRRLSGHFAQDEALWAMAWNGASIAKYLTEKENLHHRFKLDEKAERAFRSDIDQTLSLARNKGERYVLTEEEEFVLRTPADVEMIEVSVCLW
jgi:hypothetical protein